MNPIQDNALIVIDLQNDYFPNGKFPLANTDETLDTIKHAIIHAQKQNMPIVLIQHIADPNLGLAPFFNEGTSGADIHNEILAAVPNGEVIVKRFADSFEQTSLDSFLSSHGIKKLFLCGMMTQNCITHTALSKQAETYEVSILEDACTTVDTMIHKIALRAMSTRVKLMTTEQFVQSVN